MSEDASTAEGEHLAGAAIDRDRVKRDDDRLLRQILDTSPAAVYTTDADGRITYYNAAAAALAGRVPVLGKDQWCVSWRLYAPDGAPLPHDACPMALALRGEPPAHGAEILVERPDGSRLPVLAFPALLYGADGEITGAVNTLVDISDRKREEERRALLIHELNHRVKNTLAIVQSLAWQTLRGLDEHKVFQGRLEALSGAHDLLTRTQWQDAELAAVIERALAAWRNGRGHITLVGPRVRLSPKRAVTVAMAMHELATNAGKYGALSATEGTVAICWTVEGAPPRLQLIWRESDGPPVEPPTRRGFGTRMIEKALAYEFGGTARLDYLPDGLVCTIDAPLPEG
ncbi:MAG TPA: HWE histidine kinase domain-containing protein [Sphingomonas sp.]|nr:HWE histidine kinase domain-containing protein [Sphingomonas sp.]